MSEFSDDFVAANDLLDCFGETVDVSGPQGVTGSVVAIPMDAPSRFEGDRGKRDNLRRKTFEMPLNAVEGANPVVGWSVTHGGIAYAILSGERTPGGMWRCEGQSREVMGIGPGRA